jgi:hypothetical protein
LGHVRPPLPTDTTKAHERDWPWMAWQDRAVLEIQNVFWAAVRPRRKAVDTSWKPRFVPPTVTEGGSA